ncbi:DUF7427 family protein [Nocardia xishanensis]|uniref:DUF7427 family protein n=1 Tax=Nocardia xishanensis TaxID=238964 RepID=UPI00403B2722
MHAYRSRIKGEYAWLILGVSVLVYEALAPADQLLTTACARGLTRHPVLTRAAIVITAAHLLRLIPPSLDPYSGAEKLLRKWN